MKKMIPAIALVVCLAATGFAQIWTEDFTGQEGKGLSGTVALGVVTNMTGVTNWTVSGGQDLDGVVEQGQAGEHLRGGLEGTGEQQHR